MSPLEINNRIAEIKGLTIKGPGRILGSSASINTNEGHKDWAENIADAWELFEEMPSVAFVRKEYDGRYSCYNGTSAFEKGNWCIADTAPTAIATAWLGWKGVEI